MFEQQFHEQVGRLVASWSASLPLELASRASSPRLELASRSRRLHHAEGEGGVGGGEGGAGGDGAGAGAGGRGGGGGEAGGARREEGNHLCLERLANPAPAHVLAHTALWSSIGRLRLGRLRLGRPLKTLRGEVLLASDPEEGYPAGTLAKAGTRAPAAHPPTGGGAPAAHPPRRAHPLRLETRSSASARSGLRRG